MKGIKEITVYASIPVYETVRKLAFVRRLSLSKTIVQIIEDYLKNTKEA